jgi:hypothetical protein
MCRNKSPSSSCATLHESSACLLAGSANSTLGLHHLPFAEASLSHKHRKKRKAEPLEEELASEEGTDADGSEDDADDTQQESPFLATEVGVSRDSTPSMASRLPECQKLKACSPIDLGILS